VEFTRISDTSNKRGKLNHLKIIQTIPERCIEKAQNQGSVDNSHIGHCTYTSECMCIEVQNTAWNVILHVQQFVTKEYLQHNIP
jgi:hypothetical protein